MKVQAECLEIFDFLLAEIREIESVISTEEINTDDLIKLDRPLSEWDDVLKSNGFKSKLLQEFLLSAEVLELWKGEEPLIAIYQQAIEKSLTTGDFLVLLFSQDPKFLESLLNLVSPLLSERAELMEVAAGKLGKKGDIAVGLGVYFGTGLIVGAMVAYKYRKTIGSEVRELYTKASEAISNNHYGDRFIRWTSRRAEQQLKEEVFADITNKGYYEVKFEFPEFRSKDKFELALKVLDPHPLPALSSEQVQELRLEVRVDRNNPIKFGEELKTYLSENFNIKPDDYLTVLRTEYDRVVAEAKGKCYDELNKIATEKLRAELRMKNPKGWRIASIDEKVLTLERKQLIELAKSESSKPAFEKVLERFDAGAKILKLQPELEVAKAKVDILKVNLDSTLKKMMDVKEVTDVSMKKLVKSGEDISKESEELKKYYEKELAVQKELDIGLKKQITIIEKTEQKINSLLFVFKETEELKKLTNDNLKKCELEVISLHDELDKLGKLNKSNREEYLTIEKQLTEKMKTQNEILEILDELKQADKKVEYASLEESLIYYKENGKILRTFLETARVNAMKFSGKLEATRQLIQKNKSEVNTLSDQIKSNQESVNKITIDYLTAQRTYDEMQEEYEKLNFDFRVGVKSTEPFEVYLNEYEPNVVNFNISLIAKATRAVQAFKLCQDLENSLTEAKRNIRNKLKDADNDAFKDWMNSTSLPKLKYIQKTFGSDIAQIVKEKAKISVNLSEIEEEIVEEFGQEELNQIKLVIDSELAQVLDDILEPIVKNEAHKIFKEIWTAEESVEIDVDNYFDNVIEDWL